MAIASRLTARTAIVTGAGAGIGAAIARRLAEEGAWIACLDIDGDSARQTATDSPHGGRAYEADISDEQSVRTAIDAVKSDRGELHILVNNAGIAGPQTPAETTPLDEWQRTVAVNLTGTFLMSKYALPMLQQSRGVIVNIASSLALIGWRNESAYGPSKAGVVQFTRSMALDYADSVRVNCVCPGAVRTPMIESVLPEGDDVEALLKEYGKVHPLYQRLADPVEIANAVLFLASDDASLITGAALTVDAGFTAS